MADLFRLTLLPLSLLAPLAVLLTLVVLVFRKKGYCFPGALLSQQTRLYLACLILVNGLATWCFSQSGYDLNYDLVHARELQRADLIRALVVLTANLAMILVCSLPLFCQLQLLLFRRQISLIQSHGIDQRLFVALNTLCFSILTILTVPLMQFVLVQSTLIKGNVPVLLNLLDLNIAICAIPLALAGLTIAFARSGDDVRTLRTMKDEGLLPEYMADRSDRELYPLMAAAQGLLKLNRAETLKAIEALAPKPKLNKNEEQAVEIVSEPKKEN